MKETRIEILKNGIWIPLILREYQSIRYNLIINEIGSMSDRSISHSNTFELPYVHQNIQALGINVFNKTQLAKAFNSRYSARYYVKDRLSQSGYLIVNNTKNGIINVNFYDEALEIVEQWGSMNYYDLLNSKTINIPADYREGIKEMQDYVMDQTKVLKHLQKIPTRGYHIAKFPNNLNAIGDKFQINKDGVREQDTFNPYQSRPIFNVKAMFDLAIESFDYKPIYDDSVDWNRLSQTFMIDKDLSQSQKGDNNTVVKQYTAINNQRPALFNYDSFLSFYTKRTIFVYPPEVNAKSISDSGKEISLDRFWEWVQYKDYKKLDRCILVPDISVSYSGYMQWQWNTFSFNPELGGTVIQAFWQSSTNPAGVVIKNLSVDEWKLDESLGITTVKVNKTQLSVPPSGASNFIGVIYDNTSFGEFDIINNTSGVGIINGLIYTESFLPPSTISYDQFDQYEALNINLTHGAPRETIKDLLSAVMQKEGILMSFDNEKKEVKLFTYGSYITRKIENKFQDWSKYIQRWSTVAYNTDYGNEYAKRNEVGLNTPYKGNTITVELINQGTDSKYKDFVQNLSKKFKDIENVTFIQNPITPYFEYTNKGLGLVESTDVNLGDLNQVRADGTVQGVIKNLSAVYNVNGLNLPNGLVEWYDLIDNSVRAEAVFLLPVEKIKYLDLSEPIFLENLGGFYIIEKIEEYVDSQTPVLVKLIKMIIPSIELEPEPEIEEHKYSEAEYDDNYYE